MSETRSLMRAIVAMTLLLALSQPFGAGAEEAGIATPAATTVPTPPAAAAVKAEGKTMETSDYVAKNFWLGTGAVILNPFTLEDCTSNNTLCDENLNAKKRFRLKTGNTTANAFFEAGYRRRWAWQDRLSHVEAAGEKVAAATQPDRAAVKAWIDAAEKRLAASERATVVSAGRPGEAVTAFAAASDDLANAQVALARMNATARTDAAAEKQKAAKEQPESAIDVKYVWQRSDEDKGWPFDLDVRGGFLFASGTSGAAGIVGGSDFYISAAPALNLARWAWPGSNTAAPTRGAFSLELSGALNTDSGMTDTHGRYLLGVSTALGVPFQLTGGASPSNSANGITAHAEPVAELLIRVGAVNLETPTFLNKDSRQVEVQNEVPAFRSHWGLGADLELNVPITEKLGYVMARGQINSGFDPDPWTLQLGYTIPLSSLVSLVSNGS